MERKGYDSGDTKESTPHTGYMEEALREAEKALGIGEVPVGALLVYQGKIVSRGHNLTGERGDPGEHAEMIVLREAHRLLGPRLPGASLYVTLEPCPMCAGRIVLSRIDALYFGAFDLKAGAAGTLYTITDDLRLNHRVPTYGGILDARSRGLLQEYFRRRRGTGGGSEE